jgi:hypothetical protein
MQPWMALSHYCEGMWKEAAMVEPRVILVLSRTTEGRRGGRHPTPMPAGPAAVRSAPEGAVL